MLTQTSPPRGKPRVRAGLDVAHELGARRRFQPQRAVAVRAGAGLGAQGVRVLWAGERSARVEGRGGGGAEVVLGGQVVGVGGWDLT